ncbi:hypothetical protein BEL04_21380 [Mucilaginibacter sp. PPCGB 2223]|uniref:hypothetical protein n=1 Tax=Mucilaginibacter sp. PPCGB 2223 TaxID=1886027 RepID=UPI000826444A|nr:hypothetical protein [Mucilaginibacter sp. PPCGB 2223]OCX50342.1 hypothetical protein BEL04_21380 [Mucilaginibacter sp. PPCGB 2223]
MEDTQKKAWIQPELTLISKNSDVNAKGNITSIHELRNTPHYPYLVTGPAGSGNVPQTLFNSVAS